MAKDDKQRKSQRQSAESRETENTRGGCGHGTAGARNSAGGSARRSGQGSVKPAQAARNGTPGGGLSAAKSANDSNKQLLTAQHASPAGEIALSAASTGTSARAIKAQQASRSKRTQSSREGTGGSGAGKSGSGAAEGSSRHKVKAEIKAHKVVVRHLPPTLSFEQFGQICAERGFDLSKLENAPIWTSFRNSAEQAKNVNEARSFLDAYAFCQLAWSTAEPSVAFTEAIQGAQFADPKLGGVYTVTVEPSPYGKIPNPAFKPGSDAALAGTYAESEAFQTFRESYDQKLQERSEPISLALLPMVGGSDGTSSTDRIVLLDGNYGSGSLKKNAIEIAKYGVRDMDNETDKKVTVTPLMLELREKRRKANKREHARRSRTSGAPKILLSTQDSIAQAPRAMPTATVSGTMNVAAAKPKSKRKNSKGTKT
ncbi:hypothetical protein FVE85_0472 [Porphyridium purpureum]|uniref:UPF3 domain-containing protein n=1 Tax=Porphyridium purpureum TaxID=35688 RepID=A0A5J4Z1I3_PORPP|nr:hypothetical protein FVE85_0472 [Porphyridium purpureum]|eukprot:POR8976..scf208_2